MNEIKLIEALKNPHIERVQCYQTKHKAIIKEMKTHDEKSDLTCDKINILIATADLEETCFIFSMIKSLFGIDQNILLSLKDLVTEIYYPFSKQYDFYRLNYNHRFNIYPAAIVRAHTIEDIINTIKFCRKYGLPIRARGGAHCYEPASLVNFGIILDQKPRNKISKINMGEMTVDVQAGALLGPIAFELNKQNLLIPFGTCVTNGLAGLVCGGGIGFAIREYGLTMDQLLDVKIILANGTKVHANKNNNKELYWALRGAGGGNFGIITNFTFKMVKVDYVTVFTLHFKFENAKKIFKIWQEWAPFTDTKLTSEFDIFNKFQPIVITGQLLPNTNDNYDDTQKSLFDLLKPLLELNLHSNISIKTMNLVEASEYFGQGSYGRPLFFNNKSDFNFAPLSDAAIDIIIHYMSLLNEKQSYNKTEINALGGNFGKIASHSTAFPSRSAIHWLQYTSLWDVQNEEKMSVDWLNNYYTALRPYFPKNRQYVNALNYDQSKSNALKSYYGNNLSKLIDIKCKYDPTNFFNFEQSIPLSFENL